jgi:hypothetical protein
MIDPHDAREAVEHDVATALERQLPGGEGFALATDVPDLEDNPMGNEGSTAIAVPWTWHGRNEGLLGLAGTQRFVTVRGITIVTEGAGELLCQRYVDWLPVLSEAGLELSTRPIVDIRTAYDEDELRATPELAEALDEIDRLRTRP